MTAKSEKLRARQRVENIMAQLAAYEAGEQSSIICPYCAKSNSPSINRFCCSMFSKASIAALERLRVEQAKEQVERIAERHENN